MIRVFDFVIVFTFPCTPPAVFLGEEEEVYRLKQQIQDPWHGIDFLPLIQVRNHCYDLLRRTFLEKPHGIPAQLGGNRSNTLFSIFDADALIADGAQEAASYLEQFKILPDETVDELRSDYTRLFIGPISCRLLRNHYLHEERLLFQKKP